MNSDEVKYVLNAHGDVVALLNANGVVTKRYEYDAFGNELGIDNTDTNPFRYCGEYFDVQTGQIYNKTSTYDEFLRLKSVAQGGKTTAYTYDEQDS